MAHTLREWAAMGDTDDPVATRRIVLVVALLALTVRVLYYFELATKPWFGVPLLDSRWWLDDATALLRWGFADAHALFRPPLYTVFLAALTAVAGHAAPVLAPLIQLFVGVAFCCVVTLIAVRCWNIAAGVAAGCLAALYAPLVFYEQELLSDGLALFLLALCLYYIIVALQISRLREYLLAGFFAGLAALTRANALPVAIVFLAALVWLRLRCRVPAPRWKDVTAFALPVVVLVALPTLHNMRVGDPSLICAQGGINFYLGNNPEANGVNVIFPRITEQGSRYRDTVEEYAVLGYLAERYGSGQALLRYEAGDRPRWAEVDAYWYGKGFEFLVSHPRQALALYLKKFVALLNNYEVRNNRDFQYARAHESLVLRLVPFSFSLVFALGFLGALQWRRVPRPGLGWLILFFLSAAAIVLMYFVAGRLRLIVLPALFPLAGIGLEQFVHRIRERNRREVIKDALLVLLLGVLSCYSWPQLDFRFSKEQLRGDGIAASAFPAGESAMLANACLENGRPQDALRYAEEAVAEDPTFGYAWLVLGNALLVNERYGEALTAFCKALNFEPQSLRARNNLAVALEKLGRFQEAAQVYLDVLNRNPSDPRANANLAMLLLRSGDRGAARSFAQIAVENDPEIAAGHAVLQATTGPGEETTGSLAQRKIPAALLDELSVPLPVRIDLGSTRSVESILADLATSQPVLSRHRPAGR
jgi:tetratricopeptide (TPR) repeat protein